MVNATRAPQCGGATKAEWLEIAGLQTPFMAALSCIAATNDLLRRTIPITTSIPKSVDTSAHDARHLRRDL
jgi:hypothetical protein